MNREQKAAVIEEVAGQIRDAQAVFAVDPRGISVKQAADLRVRLGEAQAELRVVKNTLAERAADRAGAEALKELLDGPTAFTFVHGDAAVAAKALAGFRRETDRLQFKGGRMDGETLSVADIESISRLPAKDVLNGQLVGVVASPLTGLVRGLASLIQGLAIQLGQIQEKGLVAGAPPPSEDTPQPDEPAEPSEAPGDPVAEAAAAEDESSEAVEEAGQEQTTEAPGEEAGEEKTSEASAEGDPEAPAGENSEQEET